MKRSKNIILPFGIPIKLLIILTLLLYLIIVPIGIMMIIDGVSGDTELIVIGVVLICLFGVIFVSTNLWIIYQYKIALEHDQFTIFYFQARPRQFFKTIVPLVDLKIIEDLGNKTFNFIYNKNDHIIVELKEFSKKQILNVISIITLKAQNINGYKIEKVCS